jgi:ankyrin repeat protein
MIKAHPDVLSLLDSDGGAELHRLLCNRNMENLSIIQLLVEAYPSALILKNDLGVTPLHMACVRDEDLGVDLLVYLANWYNAVTDASDEDETLLHIICASYSNGEVFLECLQRLKLSSESVLARDSHGWNPFHILCHRYAPLPLCRALIDMCPESFLTMTGQGKYPLHLAVEGFIKAKSNQELRPHTCETLIRYLLEKFPRAVRIEDDDGMTPLSIACEYNTSLSVIYEMVRVDPVSVLGL